MAQKTVLNHVSIHVPKQSIYGLVGKNGAGKTTLMRMICGLTQPSEGSYTLLGKSNDTAIRKHMGMLIEKPGIYEHMTALENLRYFSLLFGTPSQDHSRILEMVGLQNAGKKKARQFSLGMQQRLGIAIALLGNPEFLLLDEPINGLDPEGVYEMRKLLETLNQQHGTTILIASHILSKLYKLATDYAIIDGGCLIDEFSNEEYYRTWHPKEKLLSLCCAYHIRCLFIGYAHQWYGGGISCLPKIWYGDSFLSCLLCPFHRCTHSFCHGTHQFCNHYDNPHQKCNHRVCVRACDSKYPTNVRNGFELF